MPFGRNGIDETSFRLDRRVGNHLRCRSRFRPQNFVCHIRQPVDAPILILGFERGKNQLREQIEAANVMIRESPSRCGKSLQHTDLLAASTERNQDGSASSYRPREVLFDASVGFTIVATKNASRFKAVPQKFRFADPVNAAGDGERSGSGAAHHLRRFCLRSSSRRFLRERNHDAVGPRDGLGAVRDQLQHFVQDEAFGFKQVAIGGAPRGRAPLPYLLVEVREGKQRPQSFLARNRFQNAVAFLQR